MTERADQLHHNNAPDHSTALVQAFSAKHHISHFCQSPIQPRFGSLRLLSFSKAKIAFEREETDFRDIKNDRITSGQPS